MKATEIEKALEIKSNFDKNCVVHQSLQILDNKWTLLVIMSLIKGTKRNHQILEEITGISSKVLATTLRKLLKYNIISKKTYPVVPPKVEYSLTEFGNSLIIPLNELFKWSLEKEDIIRELVKKNTKK
jgi:DNA-binding HxlR family transcriptional regulator